jgi:hypothetical protein
MREFFSRNLTLGYMTKTLNQIIFFSSTKIRIFFSATLGIRIFFLEKKHTPPPPLQVKWSFPYQGAFVKSLIFVTESGGKSTNHRHLFICGKIYINQQ